MGVKSVEMVHVQDILPITGYIRGGCSPLGMKKAFPTVLDSKANFVFAKPDGISGKALFTALRARGVLTRRWDEPLIRDYLRISIGSDAEMDEFLQRTAEILREAGR